jgi:hypothetical protein
MRFLTDRRGQKTHPRLSCRMNVGISLFGMFAVIMASMIVGVANAAPVICGLSDSTAESLYGQLAGTGRTTFGACVIDAGR